MMEKDDLEDRVEKFQAMKLPGQPIGMHMGTMYLVNEGNVTAEAESDHPADAIRLAVSRHPVLNPL